MSPIRSSANGLTVAGRVVPGSGDTPERDLKINRVSRNRLAAKRESIGPITVLRVHERQPSRVTSPSDALQHPPRRGVLLRQTH